MSRMSIQRKLVEKPNGELVYGTVVVRTKSWKNYPKIEVSLHLLSLFDRYANRCGNFMYSPTSMLKTYKNRDCCMEIDHVHERVYIYYYDTNKKDSGISHIKVKEFDFNTHILDKYFNKREVA